MSNDINSLIGEDPGVILGKAFGCLQLTVLVGDPNKAIASYLLQKKSKAKVKKKHI